MPRVRPICWRLSGFYRRQKLSRRQRCGSDPVWRKPGADRIRFFLCRPPANVQNSVGRQKDRLLNDIRQDSITAFAGIFTTVVFSPSHLGLVKDGPAGRRKFLDTSICQITPRYIGMIGQYQRILLQRNTLLKDISYASALLDTLDIWVKNCRLWAG